MLSVLGNCLDQHVPTIHTPQSEIHGWVTGAIQVPQIIHDQQPVASGAALLPQLVSDRSDLAMLDGHTTLKQRVP